jgi:sugar phosphate isomerase/epimerase
MNIISRRTFVKGTGAAAAMALQLPAWAVASNFKIGVISDEISDDFDHACSVISDNYGLRFVELRALWGKNLQDLPSDQIADARKILAKYKLTVTDIASPLFKVSFPGAPPSSYAPKADLHGATQNTFQQQDEVLRRSIDLARQFGTNKVRCFDFWRLDDVKPYRAAINEKLQQAAEFAEKQGVMLVLENEQSCNTATGREAAAILSGIPSKNLALNWDPGNAAYAGEIDAFPNGWNALPKDRIHHCHVKNAAKNAQGKMAWMPVDTGLVDWTAQFRALKQVGYSDATSLETHWKEGTPEQSSNRSWSGMKNCLVAAGCM